MSGQNYHNNLIKFIDWDTDQKTPFGTRPAVNIPSNKIDI